VILKEQVEQFSIHIIPSRFHNQLIYISPLSSHILGIKDPPIAAYISSFTTLSYRIIPYYRMTTMTSTSQKQQGIPLLNLSLTSLPSTTNGYPLSETSTVAESVTPFYASTSTFTPTTRLQIQAQGKARISFPLSHTELTTPIFNPETDRPAYLSVRPKRKSGSCALVLADDETETAIARTEYKFGPGSPPVVRIGADDDIHAESFKLVSQGLMTRAVGFETRTKGKFVWRYGKKSERTAHGAYNLLILEKVVEKGQNVRIAQLVRNDETRTPGTNKHHAGNGGRLEMALGEDEKGYFEVVVVATCLVMLKKEIDRLRTIQIAVLSAAAGAGS
jgi:hypothetical protein